MLIKVNCELEIKSRLPFIYGLTINMALVLRQKDPKSKRPLTAVVDGPVLF